MYNNAKTTTMGSSSSSSGDLTTSATTYKIKGHLISYHREHYPWNYKDLSDDKAWEKIKKRKVNVVVRSVDIGLPFNHHYIACDGITDKWLVFERTKGDYGNCYACSTVKGRYCQTLGEETVEDVYNAYLNTSVYSYSYRFENCNHFVERMASNLGYSITVSAVGCYC